VLQAEQDSVIDNLAQDRFCTRLNEVGNGCVGGKPYVIKDAKHEVFIESDRIRQDALTKISNYFK
jgi:lysophospholipase